MELRQLRYFVAVAEELHFSRAAVRLNLAQSALSSQIRHLEGEVGGPLFTRTTRHVQLTPAGEALLEEARTILATADEALVKVRALARGETGALVVGALGPAPGSLLAPLLEQFAARHPNVRVEVRAFDFTDIVRGLRDRHADVALVYMPLDEPDLVLTPLLTEERVVVLPREHRLAGRKQLAPADLAGETFITHPDSVPELWRDHWLLTDELGGRPRVAPHVATKLDDWLYLIGRGEGIDTAPAMVSRYYSWPDVRFVPLVDAKPSTLALARRAEDDRLVDELFAVAEGLRGQHVLQ